MSLCLTHDEGDVDVTVTGSVEQAPHSTDNDVPVSLCLTHDEGDVDVTVTDSVEEAPHSTHNDVLHCSTAHQRSAGSSMDVSQHCSGGLVLLVDN